MKSIITWIEIPANNLQRAVKFYGNVFNWELEIQDWGTEKMACLPNDAGAISWAPGFNPSKDGVLVSLNTGKELDAVINRIIQNGGSVLIPKTKIEAENRGWFATFADSEGNRVGLYGDV